MRIEASTILSSKHTENLIRSAVSPLSSRQPSSSASASRKLADRSAKQQAYAQQCLYRAVIPVTSFKVHDPDPNAVDGGHVIGLRFEIMSRAEFLRPYYVMLNRPFPASKHLRVHRHTLPPAIPLAGLAARHLPAPKSDSAKAPKQNLDRFVRRLRREVARYHNRLGVSADLRRALGLHETDAGEQGTSKVVEVGLADIEAKQIKLTWADGGSSRLVMDDDGNVLRVVTFGKQGRKWDAHLKIGPSERIEDVAKTLIDYRLGLAGDL